MKLARLDTVLRDWRYRMAEPYIPDGSRVLDIGGFDDSLLKRIRHRIHSGVCIDPLVENRREDNLTFMKSAVSDKPSVCRGFR